MNAKPSIECPTCGSTLVEYLRNPETHDVVCGTHGMMLLCRVCKDVFSISPAQAKEGGGFESPGEQIEIDRPCPSCGYNLKTLVIGHRCPECGNVIEPRSGHSQQRTVALPFGLFVAVPIFVLALVGVFVSPFRFMGFTQRKPSFLWLIAVWFLFMAQLVCIAERFEIDSIRLLDPSPGGRRQSYACYSS